jgi:hypothetical protein
MSEEVHLLLATIPARRPSVSRLLVDLSQQSVLPDCLHLVLDGYGEDAAPSCATFPEGVRLSVVRTPAPSGPGGRWKVALGMPADALLVVMDDDQRLCAPDIVETLVRSVRERGGAVSHMGTDKTGWGMAFPAGTELIAMGAAMMALRVGDLVGLEATLEEVRSKGGFDPFGDAGDDEAVVAAHLWKRGVTMRASGPLKVLTDTSAQAHSQSSRRMASRGTKHPFWQRHEIRRITGWPWTSLLG